MTLDYEQSLWERAIAPIGVDEAGRGALAGPVVAAAVVLNPARIPEGIDDSKKLKPLARELLREQIVHSALAWSVGIIGARRIDEINILQATFEAMLQAIDGCRAQLELQRSVHLLIDGNRFPSHELAHTTIVGGDALSVSIAAASIIAKTTRDRIMQQNVHADHPCYGFDVHKGYGTAVHRERLVAQGPCSEHRRSFLSKILAEGC
ncbi:MAG: ribonuclease HII [Ignavibacteria bacterium]|jgi:ribonuclease HII